MKVRWWILALLPVLVGLAASALVLWSDALPNPILYVRANLNVFLFLVGLGLSIVLAVGLGVRERAARRTHKLVAELHEQSTEARRQFLQRLDHELKNPLTAIRAGLANVAGEAMAVERRDALASVEAQVVRLSHLTADLRKLAELEDRPLERTSIDVADLLREAVALAEEQRKADQQRLSLVLPQAPWPVSNVSGDWDLLFLAAYNLLDNAIKFTRPGDTVEVRAFEDGNAVVIAVADTGPGIPDAEAPRVWEELYRGQAARGIPGSGLGLALVRAIVERHGGQVSLRSREGQGTVVSMRLPIK